MTANGDLDLWEAPGTDPAKAIDFSNCNHISIGGTIYAYGTLEIGKNLTVTGDVVSVNGSVVDSGASIGGHVYAAHPTTGQQAIAAYPADKLPSVFSETSLWTDVVKSDIPLSDTTHYDVRTVTDCNTTGWLTGIVNTTTRNTIVDATGCSSFKVGNTTLALRHDLTVLLPNTSVDLNGGSVKSQDGGRYQFNVIQLDQVDQLAANPPGTPKADCPSQNEDLNISGFTMNPGTAAVPSSDPLVTGLAYTPCDIKAGSTGGQWWGQVFGGDYPAGFESNDPIIYRGMSSVPGLANPKGFVTGGHPHLVPANVLADLRGQTEP